MYSGNFLGSHKSALNFPSLTMEAVAKWLAMMGAMSGAAAADCRTCAQLAAELHNGVALATVALKLWGRPSNNLIRAYNMVFKPQSDADGAAERQSGGGHRRNEVIMRPSLDVHRRANVRRFVAAYDAAFKPFKSAKFNCDDVEMRRNTGQVVAALHHVAKALEGRLKIRPFTMPKPKAFECSGRRVSRVYQSAYDAPKNFEDILGMRDASNLKFYRDLYNCGRLDEGDVPGGDSGYARAVRELFAKNREAIQ